MQERQYICFQEEKEKRKYKDNTEGVYIKKNSRQEIKLNKNETSLNDSTHINFNNSKAEFFFFFDQGVSTIR